MRALQIPAPGVHRVVDVPVPAVGPDEVMVEVGLCATCTQWDITTWTGVDIFERAGYPAYPLPDGATGHELAGTVVRVGPEVTRLREGDLVAYWGDPGVPREPVCGGYAEYHVASERSYVRFPAGTPLPTVALAELLTCLASALFRAGDVTGKRVGVSGLGPAGLLAVQALKVRGAAEVLAFDVVPERIALARELGADGGMVPESAEWERLLPRAANLDIAIDCIGLARSVTNLMRITRDHLVIFGVPHGEIRYGLAEWGKGLRLDAAGPRRPEGAEYAAELLGSGQVTVDCLIEHVLPLERYDEGVQLLMDKRAIKVAFDPRALA